MSLVKLGGLDRLADRAIGDRRAIPDGCHEKRLKRVFVRATDAGQGDAMTSELASLKDTKTILLTTFKRDGAPVATPVSIAFDHDRAFFRSYDKAWKTKRLRRNERVNVAPATFRGRPTGSTVNVRAVLLFWKPSRDRGQGAGPSASGPAGGCGPLGAPCHALRNTPLRAAPPDAQRALTLRTALPGGARRCRL